MVMFDNYRTSKLRQSVAYIKKAAVKRQPPYELPADAEIERIVVNINNIMSGCGHEMLLHHDLKLWYCPICGLEGKNHTDGK